MKSFKIGTAISLALMIVLTASMQTAAGQLQQQLAAESALETIMKRCVLKVGMDIFKPWAMKDKTGQLIGFEIDVAKRLAKDMGVKAEFVPTNWNGIIPALLTGKFDVIIGGMSVRPDRNLKVNFSIPYDYAGQSIVANRKLAGTFTSLDEFNRSDVVVTAKLGTSAASAVEKYFPKAQRKYFDSEAQTIQELINGRAHALVASKPFPAEKAMEYPDKLFLPVSGTFTKEPIGFALRKGDFDTLNFFNNWIRVVEAEGWLTELRQYWFESNQWEDQIQ